MRGSQACTIKPVLQAASSERCLQVLPAWHSLMVSRRPVALYVSNCQQVPAIVASSKCRVSIPARMCKQSLLLLPLLLLLLPAHTAFGS